MHIIIWILVRIISRLQAIAEERSSYKSLAGISKMAVIVSSQKSSGFYTSTLVLHIFIRRRISSRLVINKNTAETLLHPNTISWVSLTAAVLFCT